MHASRSTALAIGLVAVLAVGLSAGCSGDASDATSDPTPAVAAVTPSPGVVSLVDPAAFEATIAEPGVTILDVRTPQEFEQGHIEGAVNIDIEDPATFVEQTAALDPAATYAVYCRSGNRSANATEYLKGQGFGSILELDGGVLAWDDAGLPLAQ